MGELWKQCGSWLVRMGVLPPNHRICWPDATVQDLAYALRSAEQGHLRCLDSWVLQYDVNREIVPYLFSGCVFALLIDVKSYRYIPVDSRGTSQFPKKQEVDRS